MQTWNPSAEKAETRDHWGFSASQFGQIYKVQGETLL